MTYPIFEGCRCYRAPAEVPNSNPHISLPTLRVISDLVSSVCTRQRGGKARVEVKTGADILVIARVLPLHGVAYAREAAIEAAASKKNTTRANVMSGELVVRCESTMGKALTKKRLAGVLQGSTGL